MGQKGAFILGQVHSQRLSSAPFPTRLTGNINAVVPNLWENGPVTSIGTNGWFMIGAPSPAAFSSVVSRIDFANDSPTAGLSRGPLTLSRYGIAASANANYSWVGGGNPTGGSSDSRVERIDYSNDLSATSSRGPLNSARYYHAAFGTANYGWHGAGSVGAPTTSAVDRIDFANDSPTIGSNRGPLTLARNLLAAVNNANFGWFGGGNPLTSVVERINLSNDSPTTASPRGPLSLARNSLAATSNANYGWFGGGSVPAAAATVDRIDFANDSPTTASARGTLSTARTILAATSNANYGWFGGGYNVSALSIVDRIDFANDSPTAASARGPLSSTSFRNSASSNYVKIIPSLIYPTQGLGTNQALAGYGWFGGGKTPTATSIVNRIDFANDSPTTASVRSPLSSAKYGTAGVNNANYGWFGGGFTPNVLTTVDRLDYANDSPTSTSPRGPLSSARYNLAATSNANFGWFVGGWNVTPLSNIDRIDFANDSPTSASPRGPLSLGMRNFAGTGNANYGWFGGGFNPTPAPVSRVDRLDYANDSPTSTSPRGTLSLARVLLGAAGNANFGWFAGGTPVATSIVDRIDFANDSPTTASPRGPLSSTRYGLSGAGNANYGWFGGGSSITSVVNRIDYTNDSPTVASVRGPLSAARYWMGATSNYVEPSLGQTALQQPFIGGNIIGTFGWFGGGYGGGNNSIRRIDFANDTATASPRGILNFPFGIREMAGVGNANYGWWVGGYGSFIGRSSQISRIDFANDSPATVPNRGRLNRAVNLLTATGNANYLWATAGNSSGGISSYVERVDFSNDNVLASIRGPITSARWRLAGAGNINFGWVGGGQTPAPAVISTVDRIVYSNDTIATLARGPLSAVKTQLVATGNPNYGWFSGGYTAANLSTVDRIDWANDTVAASVRGPLSLARREIGSAGNANFGWFAAGSTPGNSSTIDRIDYANDSPTTASPRGSYGGDTSALTGLSNYVQLPQIFSVALYSKGATLVGTNGLGTFGWFATGAVAGPTPVSTIDRIDFANDSPSTASIRGPLSTAKLSLTGVSNANFGWYGGGYFPPSTFFSSVDRIDFANDSPTTSSVRGALSVSRYNHASTSNANYGWFATGQTASFSPVSSVDRIDFANDSPTTASVRGPLSAARYQQIATGNSNYGWFAGGVSPIVSSVNRIDFSNDSPATASVRGPLSLARYGLAASGNANYGWFAGGYVPGSGSRSTVDRIDWSNDSPTAASARGPLSLARLNPGGAGNANFGWFAGGLATIGSQRSTVDRIDFANDSPTSASVRGPLSSTRSATAGISNYIK